MGILFAGGRRTVTTWLRAAGIGDDYQDDYYFIASVGRNARSASYRLWDLVLEVLPLPERVSVVLDDTPTKRYGPCVEGASLQHNPTPGPADQKFLYGHIWVTLALAMRPPSWGTIGLPLRDVVRAATRHGEDPAAAWLEVPHQTGVGSAPGGVDCFADHQRSEETAVDFRRRLLFYAKRPFLEPCRRVGAVVVSRLRKDAALRNLPVPRRRQRGRPRIYGVQPISLAKRAGQPPRAIAAIHRGTIPSDVLRMRIGAKP